MATEKLTRLAKGVYGTPDGEYQIYKDGYSPVHVSDASETDGRFTRHRRPHEDLYEGPEEVCWIVVHKQNLEDNLIIVDTLGEARGFIARHRKEMVKSD